MQSRLWLEGKAYGLVIVCIGLGAWLSGCAGNNDVQIKEITSPTQSKDFVEMTFVEEESKVQIPADLEATIKNQTADYLEKTTKQLKRDVDMAQSLGKLKGLKPRKLVLHYQIVGYDPGTPFLRGILGKFGVGAGHLTVDFHFRDENGIDVGNSQAVVVLAAEKQWLQSDTELFSALVLQAAAKSYDKQYRPNYDQLSKQ